MPASVAPGRGVWTARGEVLCLACGRADPARATAASPRDPSGARDFGHCDRCGVRVWVGEGIAALQAAVRCAILQGYTANLTQAGGMLCVGDIIVNPRVDEVDQAILRLTDGDRGVMEAYLCPQGDVPGVRLRAVTGPGLGALLRRLSAIVPMCEAWDRPPRKSGLP